MKKRFFITFVIIAVLLTTGCGRDSDPPKAFMAASATYDEARRLALDSDVLSDDGAEGVFRVVESIGDVVGKNTPFTVELSVGSEDNETIRTLTLSERSLSHDNQTMRALLKASLLVEVCSEDGLAHCADLMASDQVKIVSALVNWEVDGERFWLFDEDANGTWDSNEKGGL